MKAAKNTWRLFSLPDGRRSDETNNAGEKRQNAQANAKPAQRASFEVALFSHKTTDCSRFAYA
jgi:hypothetical protein